MDRLIYTAMSGAKQTLEQQAAVSNNGQRLHAGLPRADQYVPRGAGSGQYQPTRAFTRPARREPTSRPAR